MHIKDINFFPSKYNTHSSLCDVLDALGIREGTVASAILIGLFVRQFKKPAERVVKRVTGNI